jgi:3-phosphoshikimate 1-carboxyvinyltransferase
MIIIPPANQKVNAAISLPASKSISNRLLIIQHLSHKHLEINNLSDADDTHLLRRLLVDINKNIGSETPVILDCRNAGTTFRFLAALLSLTPGKWLLSGSQRMKQRPVGILVDALGELGAEIEYDGFPGFPPLLIRGTEIQGGTIVQVPGNISSQFISALMLIAPNLKQGLQINLSGDIVSEPYIEMTAGLMQQCGAEVEFNDKTIKIASGLYMLNHSVLTVEPDWSSAAFWYEMVALSGDGEVMLPGLKLISLQGDAAVAEIFESLGVSTMESREGIFLKKSVKRPVDEFNRDFSSCPDLAQAVAVTCAGLSIPARLTGLSGLRIKETDRLDALVSELKTAGYDAVSDGDSELVIPGNRRNKKLGRNKIETYSDHRMAMAFAPLALETGTIEIDDPWVVSKSYPGFWNDLKSAGFILTGINEA